MTPKSRKGLPLLTMFSTFCSFDAGFPHLCAVKARKGAVALAYILVQQPLLYLPIDNRVPTVYTVNIQTQRRRQT